MYRKVLALVVHKLGIDTLDPAASDSTNGQWVSQRVHQLHIWATDLAADTKIDRKQLPGWAIDEEHWADAPSKPFSSMIQPIRFTE